MSNLKLIYFKGLPGSGKSTLAKRMLSENSDAVRINKDDLRDILGNKNSKLADVFDVNKLAKMIFMSDTMTKNRIKFSEGAQEKLLSQFDGKKLDKLISAQRAKSFGPLEKIVIDVETYILHYFVQKQKDIIVDNTGYNPTHITRIRDICKNYELEVHDMHQDYGVTLEQCIERNAKRDRVVPTSVIYSMANKYNVFECTESPKHIQKKFTSKNGKYVIFDIDGTLADCDHRLHFIDGTDGKKNWKAFFAAMSQDPVRENIKQLIDLTYADREIVIVTGRPIDYKEATEAWLKKHNIRYNALYMRKYRDRRPDTEAKQEILDFYLDKNLIEMVVDDRPSVIAMWRSNKLSVIDVGDRKEF
jgi:predicted kinase